MKRTLLFGFIALLIGFSFSAFARNLELTDYLDWEEVGAPALSPDGKQIIYTRGRVNKVKDRKDYELWIMNVDGSRNRFLVKGYAVQWSPSGNRIAWLAQSESGSPEVFVRYMDTEGSATQITYNTRSPDGLKWSPDGKTIAFRAQVPEPASELALQLPGRPEGAEWTRDPVIIERLHYRLDRLGFKNTYKHLFLVPADGGTPKQLTSGNWDVGRQLIGVMDLGPSFDWTPDGESIVFAAHAVDEEPLSGQSAIHAVDVSNGKIRQISRINGTWGSPKVSPDGKTVAYWGHEIEEKNWVLPSLRVINLDGTDERVLASELPDLIAHYEWGLRSKALYLSINEKGSTHLTRYSLSGKRQQITEGAHQFRVTSIGKRNVAVGILTAPQMTPNVALVNLKNGEFQQLTDVNGDILADVALGSVEEIWYTSTDNTQVQGWIVKPPHFDPDKRYPLLLEIHGGPNGMYGVDFNFRFQEFAANDYVVLYTNPRGSTGYDQEFVDAIDNAYPGQADYDDLMAGVDAVLARGYVDDKRLYVTGCSGGGTLTNWIVTQTNRFAAAVSLCSISNWISMAGTSDVSVWASTRFRPPFWQDATRWLEHSPIMHVENVTTPTLLITGENDLRTPLAQAEEFYVALKSRGVPTALIPMRKEFHGTWSVPSNMLRTQLFSRQWFERFRGD